MSVAARVARSLEGGQARAGALSRAVSELWAVASPRVLEKRLEFGPDARIIVVGGATLGGSGKTPLAMACARALASFGEPVAFVGHAYGAVPEGAHVVLPNDHVFRAGDEALMVARAFASLSIPVPVIVGPTQQMALDFALSSRRVAVVDGPIQLRPRRATLALLAVDAEEPWGGGACPPAGDLRAPPQGLADLADLIGAIGEDVPPVPDIATLGRPTFPVRVRTRGAWVGDSLWTWETLARRRVGLWTSVARPGRVTRLLGRHGVHPTLSFAWSDHGMPSQAETTVRARRGEAERIDLWLCTAKCATRLPPTLEGVPLGIIDYELQLGPWLERELRAALE